MARESSSRCFEVLSLGNESERILLMMDCWPAGEGCYKVRSRSMLSDIDASELSVMDAYAFKLGCVAEGVWLQSPTKTGSSPRFRE